MASFPERISLVWTHTFIDTELSPIPQRKSSMHDGNLILSADQSCYSFDAVLDTHNPIVVKNNSLEEYGVRSSFGCNMLIGGKIVHFWMMEVWDIPPDQVCADENGIMTTSGGIKTGKPAYDIIKVEYRITIIRSRKILSGISCCIPAKFVHAWIVECRNYRQQFLCGI